MDYNSYFYCQLTLQLMVDPVIDAEGNTFERSAIEEWIKKEGTSPITRNPIAISDLRCNRALKSAISEDRAKFITGTAAVGAIKPEAPVDKKAYAGATPNIDAGVENLNTLDAKVHADGLLSVPSYDGYFITKVAVFLFTGKLNRLVMLNRGLGLRAVPQDSVLPTDKTILSAAHRVLIRDFGQYINMNNICRFVWNGDTAVYTAATRDNINTRGDGLQVRLTPVSQIISAIFEPDLTHAIRFDEPNKQMTIAVLEQLGNMTSTTVWECKLGNGMWAPYDQRTQQLLVCAEKDAVNIVRVMISSIPYDICVSELEQRRVDGKYNTVRAIRKISTGDFCN